MCVRYAAYLVEAGDGWHGQHLSKSDEPREMQETIASLLAGLAFLAIRAILMEFHSEGGESICLADLHR